jgi:hypothetical protein
MAAHIGVMLCSGTHLVGDVQGQSSWGTEDAAATTADKDGPLPADMAAHMGTGQPAITGDYRRLPAITGDYRQLPVITGNYRRLLAITGDYR